MSPVPSEIHNRRYISLASFRKNGTAVYTPLWFAEIEGKLYFMTSSQTGKVKRIRNNSTVKVAPCTMRGKIIGHESPGIARLLPQEQFARVRKAINAKYWLARLPLVWRKTDTYIEVTPTSA